MSAADVLKDSPAAKRGIEQAEVAMVEANGADIAPWVERIEPHMRQTLEGMVATGRELIEAKAALPHGRFGPLLDKLGMSPRVAQMFMRVANHPTIANAKPGSHLPLSLSVLNVLAQLDEPELTEAVEQGEVTPATTRGEAQAVVMNRVRRHEANQKLRALHEQRHAAVRELAATGATTRQIARELSMSVASVRQDAQLLGIHLVEAEKANVTTVTNTKNDDEAMLRRLVADVGQAVDLLQGIEFEALPDEVRDEAAATLGGYLGDLNHIMHRLMGVDS